MKLKTSFLTALLVFVCFSFVAYSYMDGQKSLNTDPFKDGVAMFMVSHTEYWTAEQGQIIGKLIDYKLDPIIVNYCLVDTWYPSNKSKFINSAFTIDTLQATTGTHYYSFTTPAVEGVYEYMMTCNYNKSSSQDVNVTTSNSFHLNPALNEIKRLNSSLNTITTALGSVNFTYEFANINTQFGTVFIDLSQINSTVNQIRSDQFTKDMAQNNFTFTNSLITQVQNNISLLTQMCSNAETNSSALCQLVYEINSKVDNVQSTINTVETTVNNINATVTTTYSYLTIDLTNLINNVYSQVNGTFTTVNDINATVNDIKVNTSAIRNTQLETVYISVFS